MFRSAASLIAKKTAIVAITGVTLIGGATLALANTEVFQEPTDESAGGVIETPVVADEPTVECPPPADEDTGDATTDTGDTTGDTTADTGDTGDATGDTGDTTGDPVDAGDTGGDVTTQSSDCEGAEGDDTDVDDPTAVEDGADAGEEAGEETGEETAEEAGEEEGDLQEPELDLQEPELVEEEVAEDNHGAAVSQAAKDCKTDMGEAKNHGQCVREVARKKGAEAPVTEEEPAITDEPITEDLAPVADEPAEPTAEMQSAPEKPGNGGGEPAHAGGKGKKS